MSVALIILIKSDGFEENCVEKHGGFLFTKFCKSQIRSLIKCEKWNFWHSFC